jgi:thiol-disulfide isomerase/thioredoxin
MRALFKLCVVMLSALAPAAWCASGTTLTPLGGEAAPALVLKDLNGAQHDLARYRGSVVLVNFWATWCEPCRHEMPSIQRLREKLAGKPFVVLAVNVDEPDARVRRFLDETKFDLPVPMDTNKSVTRGWGVRVLPATYIVGPDGRLRYRAIGDLDWSSDYVLETIRKLMPSG